MGIKNLAARTALAKMPWERGNKILASRELTLGFKPIEGLKSGDQVIYNGGGVVKCLEKKEIGTVCRVFNPPVEKLTDVGYARITDFTMLSVDEDGDIFEFGFDSRYFKRKES
jgi:hypothetical protein